MQDIKALQTGNRRRVQLGNSDWSPALFGNAEVHAKNNVNLFMPTLQ